ncbi:MAG: hypothetical protein GTO24_16370 [candidate division Zixibacteria bacterium]|nr:hypothetical protein [candidate division Zixibacteria bacterium]
MKNKNLEQGSTVAETVTEMRLVAGHLRALGELCDCVGDDTAYDFAVRTTVMTASRLVEDINGSMGRLAREFNLEYRPIK